ncbi:MAG: DUF2339 domain-containing protein [Gemmatimonadetes bacterium]|jgi:uncharacterized membrane protein|nr:DUF2339 domain-containing protein [Gemmatimonadota bacterium]
MTDRIDLTAALQDLRNIVQSVESRVRRLESLAGDPGVENAAAVSAEESVVPEASEEPGRPGKVDALEQEIGERWLGPAGIVALVVGTAFFINYPFGPAFPQGLQVVISYLIAGGMFFLSRKGGERYPFAAHLLFAGSLLLLYLSTLRLHFFTPEPILSSRTLGLALLLLVPAGGFYAATRRRAEHLAILALLLGLATAVFSDAVHLTLGLVAATAAGVVWVGQRQGWRLAILIGLPLVYVAHLLWFFNNPLLGHPIQAVPEHHFNLIYVFIYCALFGAVDLFQQPEEDVDLFGSSLAFGNCAGLIALVALVGPVHFPSQLSALYLLATIACLGLASLYWVYRQNRLTTAIYACFGYMALSVAIITHFASPEQFVWLAWQSLLVISTAIWFRSKIVVTANIFIYAGILLVYLLLELPQLSVNLSYAAVALLSARVMNWQKQRLELKTELMRNSYLFSAFVIVPYGLYHGVPASYISLSFLGVAAFYFALSVLLKNEKYRWMAILTMLLTVVYVFLVDLGRLGPAFRIISLLVLGLALTVVSLLYTRHRQH